MKEDSLRSWIILLVKVGMQADKEFFESSKAPIEVKMLKFKLSYAAQSQHKLCEPPIIPVSVTTLDAAGVKYRMFTK